MKGAPARGVALRRTATVSAVTSAAYVAYLDGGYAAVASREDLLPATATLLRPLVADRGEAPLTVHVEVAHLFAAYGGELEAMVNRFARATESAADPQIAYALRGARRFLRFSDSIEAAELLVGADEGGVGGVLWRMALSPLVNPPPIPPLPLPPAHLRPGQPPNRNAAAPSQHL